jgi:DNA polymerase/3'-5' exonuclease PolX
MNVLNLIDRALSPPRPDVEPYVAVARKIMEVSGVDLGTKAELDILRKCQADFAAGKDTIKKFNYNTSKSAWLAHRKELEESVRSGQIHSIDGYGETEFEQEHIMKMEAGKGACRAAARACIPVARKVADRFAAVADKLAASQEADERRAYTKFDLKFPGGSPLLELLKTTGEWARARVPQDISAAGCGTAPDSMLPYLDW